MTIQRCAHLKPESPARLYTTMGITMELCDECIAEMDSRLVEKPSNGQTPIERAAEQRPRGGLFNA